MEYTIIGSKESARRKKAAELLYESTQDDFMRVMHNEEAHKKCLNPDPSYHVTDCLNLYKDIFDQYPDISPKTIFERYLKDEENKVRRLKYDVIPAEQYHNLLKRYMEMGEQARIPMDVVVSWYNKIKRNTVILYYITYMYHRKEGFPFEIIPFETTNPVEAQIWLYSNTNFYDWATFSNGQPGFTDRAFEQLFPILKEYRENMTAGEILILVNRLLQVSHPLIKLRDFSECFIEGGRKTCDRITNG